MSQLRIPNQRAVVDRRALSGEIAALAGGGKDARPLIVATLKAALEAGRAELEEVAAGQG